MTVTMVNVGIVSVAVFETRMKMRVGVRFTFRIAGRMFVLMMFVMNMKMIVRHGLVDMAVAMLLAHV